MGQQRRDKDHNVETKTTTQGQRTRLTRILEHRLQLSLVHVLVVPDLVNVGRDGNVRRQEENVVNCEKEKDRPALQSAHCHTHATPQPRGAISSISYDSAPWQQHTPARAVR